ncbi:MAG: phytoene/squalene synthase family protein [Alphaproteobacteria bacterium]
MKKNMLSYCGDLVQKAEPDLFLLSMFAHVERREDLWALFAFHHEIAKTRDVVSESTLGLIRLQWWRDSIGEIYDDGYVQAHEVLKPLADAIEKYDLPRDHFDKLIYAREFDLENVSPGNVEGLLNYCDFTTAPLFELAVQITGDDPAQHIIQPIAINYGLAKVLMAAPYFAKGGRLMLPEDLCNQHGVTLDRFFDEKHAGGLRAVIEGSMDGALEIVATEQVFLKGAQALSQIYLKNIKDNKYNILSEKLKVEPPFKMLRLFWKMKVL